jgi:hypothetical protein
MDFVWIWTLAVLHAGALPFGFAAWRLTGLGYPRLVILNLHQDEDCAMKPGRVIELDRAA